MFAPLVIPKDLQRALPFKDKPKVPKSSKDPVQSSRIAVVREPKERQVGCFAFYCVVLVQSAVCAVVILSVHSSSCYLFAHECMTERNVCELLYLLFDCVDRQPPLTVVTE